MIDIAMLSCNRRRITETSIVELAQRTVTPYRLIVVDSGSTDDTPEMLVEWYRKGVIHHLVLLDENVGVHWGHNLQLGLVETDLYVCTDDDIVPPCPTEEGDWLVRLVGLMERHPDYAAIACRPHVFIGQAASLFDGSPEVKEMSHVGAVLRIMRTEAVRAVGGWRKEKRPERNNEEWWIGGRLREAGYEVGYARDIQVIHLWGDDELGEDPWGYPMGSKHGHRDIWPPVNHFSWDRMGINWGTCK